MGIVITLNVILLDVMNTYYIFALTVGKNLCGDEDL